MATEARLCDIIESGVVISVIGEVDSIPAAVKAKMTTISDSLQVWLSIVKARFFKLNPSIKLPTPTSELYELDKAKIKLATDAATAERLEVLLDWRDLQKLLHQPSGVAPPPSGSMNNQPKTAQPKSDDPTVSYAAAHTHLQPTEQKLKVLKEYPINIYPTELF